MPSAGLGELSLTALHTAVDDADTIGRFQAKLRSVPGSDCLWFVGAVSARGHGRFWLESQGGRNVVMIAHRFAWALDRGIDSLLTTPVLGHRCDNPLCQRIGPDHVVASSSVANRREWAARRHTIGSALRDSRGSRGRARALRDLLRTVDGTTPDALRELAGSGLIFDAAQMPLWTPELARV